MDVLHYTNSEGNFHVKNKFGHIQSQVRICLDCISEMKRVTESGQQGPKP